MVSFSSRVIACALAAAVCCTPVPALASTSVSLNTTCADLMQEDMPKVVLLLLVGYSRGSMGDDRPLSSKALKEYYRRLNEICHAVPEANLLDVLKDPYLHL